MSEFDYGFGNMGDADSERGEAILGQFHSAMEYYYGTKYPLTFNELIGRYKPGIIEGIGLAANVAGMSESSTESAMEHLALAGNGRIPASWNGYIGALTGQAMPSQWLEVVETTLNETGELVHTVLDPVVDNAQAVMNLVKIGPYIMYGLGGLLLLAVWQNRKDVGGLLLGGAKTVAGAATGGILNIGTAATGAAVRRLNK